MSDDLDDLLPPAPAEIVPVPTRPLTTRRKAEDLARVTDELLEESQSILRDSQAFADLTEEMLQSGSPPQEWVDELGEKRAAKRFRIAKYALMTKKDCPVGLEMARALAVGILSSKAREKGGDKHLHVNYVNVPAPPQYETMTLEKK